MPIPIFDECFVELRCTKCKNYLSYLPITIHRTEGTICGRCEIPAGVSFRNHSYEIITRVIKFPCRYNNVGCPERLMPHNIPEHEETCEFRTVNCPLKQYLNCKWRGLYSKSIQHCRLDHFAFTRQGEFQNNYTKPNWIIVIHQNELFFNQIVFNADLNKFTFSIHHIGSEHYNNYYYKIELKNYLTSEKTTYSSNFTSDNIERCIVDACVPNIPDYYPNIYGIFTITTKAEAAFNALESLLKCNFCSNYIKQFLYSCEDNHIFCAECMNSHKTTCAKRIEYNYDYLNRFVEVFDYPCKYTNRGCFYMSKRSEMNLHETKCPYGGRIVCSFIEPSKKSKCVKILSPNDILQHFYIHHSLEIYTNQVSHNDIALKVSCNFQYCIGYYERAFILKFSNDIGKMKLIWSVSRVDCYEDNENYKYALYVFDVNQKLIFFCKGRSSINVDYHQIGYCKSISFKVQVTK